MSIFGKETTTLPPSITDTHELTIVFNHGGVDRIAITNDTIESFLQDLELLVVNNKQYIPIEDVKKKVYY